MNRFTVKEWLARSAVIQFQNEVVCWPFCSAIESACLLGLTNGSTGPGLVSSQKMRERKKEIKKEIKEESKKESEKDRRDQKREGARKAGKVKVTSPLSTAFDVFIGQDWCPQQALHNLQVEQFSFYSVIHLTSSSEPQFNSAVYVFKWYNYKIAFDSNLEL